MPGDIESGKLDFHDIFFFVLTEFGDLFNVFIGDLLQFFFAALEIILCYELFLLIFTDLVMRITADISDRNARLFETMVHVLDEIAAALKTLGYPA